MTLCTEGKGCHEEKVPCGSELPKLRCYKINSYDALNWDEARSKCLSMGGKLAEFTDEYSFDYVKKFVWEQKAVFIGGSDQKNEGTWVWNTTGKPVTLKKWTKKPKKPDGGNCMTWWKEEGWDDDLCSLKIGYMCQKDRPHAQGGSCENWLDDSVQERKCIMKLCLEGHGCYEENVPCGLNLPKLRCYRRDINAGGSWTQSKSKCQAMGGYLAEFTDEYSFNYVQNYIYDGEVFYIGASDRAKEGTWQWTSGKPVELKKWTPKKNPDGGRWQNCMTWWRKTGWDDDLCNQAY
jgi:hypothetical protein